MIKWIKARWMLWLLRIDLNASSSTQRSVLMSLLTDTTPWWDLQCRLYRTICLAKQVKGVRFRQPSCGDIVNGQSVYEIGIPGYGWYRLRRLGKGKWKVAILPERSGH